MSLNIFRRELKKTYRVRVFTDLIFNFIKRKAGKQSVGLGLDVYKVVGAFSELRHDVVANHVTNLELLHVLQITLNECTSMNDDAKEFHRLFFPANIIVSVTLINKNGTYFWKVRTLKRDEIASTSYSVQPSNKLVSSRSTSKMRFVWFASMSLITRGILPNNLNFN